MPKIIFFCFFLLIGFSVKAQTLEVSHPFLIGDFFDFGILNPFERCNNSIIVTNSLDCRMQQQNRRMQIRLPVNFLITNSATPVDVQIIRRQQPVPGSRLRFSVRRNGSSIGGNSTETFQPNVPEDLEFRINIWLFGPDATDQQIGEVELNLIIP